MPNSLTADIAAANAARVSQNVNTFILLPYAPIFLSWLSMCSLPGSRLPNNRCRHICVAPCTLTNSYSGSSYYTNSTSLSTKFYQKLLDRCWRRSGKLLYRPNQRDSCCPHYTIRLAASAYKPTRDQRQTINRFNNYITGDAYSKEAARRFPRSKEEAKRRNNEFSLLERVHEAEHDQLHAQLEAAHKLVVTLEPADFTEEKYAVYDNYQKVIHKDAPEDRTRKGFKRFLCSSTLRREVLESPNGKKRRLGSYHQCYRLDGKLVAVGVLDLLPDCVSSVYFMYDESIHRFSPGKLAAMREIALALEDGYKWWYPGYYIHSCTKMRYKMDFGPQSILDPVSLEWDPLDKTVLDLLDKKPFVSLAEEKGKHKLQDANAEQRKSEIAKDGDDGDDEDDDFGGSLFNSNMPGIPPVSELESLDLDHIALRGPSAVRLFETSHLVGWESSSIHGGARSVKAHIAELVAAMGTDTIDSICIDLRS